MWPEIRIIIVWQFVQLLIILVQVNFTLRGNAPQLRALSYYLILFPSLDVMSAYPLTVICIVNNVYMALTGRDTSEKARSKYDWILRLGLRVTIAVLPLFLAFAAANLVFILQYAGLLGFAIGFLFPVILQLRSIYVCRKYFGQQRKSPKGDVVVIVNTEKTPLVEAADKPWYSPKTRHYMTPYSNAIISHPIFVIIIGCIGFSLFVISFVSLFIGPDQLSCKYYP